MASARPWRHVSLALCAAVGLASLLTGAGRCLHEESGIDPPAPEEGKVEGNHTVLLDGRPVLGNIGVNKTKFYYYENINVTTMNQPERYRKLIISLEPCEGVVYLMVRKTRRCWPDAHSCCQPLPGQPGSPHAPPCDTATHRVQCGWTHFHSVADGSRDGSPTFFEVPHSSTKYFIAVFAPSEVNLNHGVPKPKYRLTVLADVGAFPRPGRQGHLQAKNAGERTVEVSWDAATFIPFGVSDLRSYHLYSSLLIHSDKKQSDAVFISPSKVMNSACGLEMNAVRYGLPIGPASCQQGTCKAVISGVVPRRRYMLNIVAESGRGLNSTYSGIIVSSDWADSRHAFADWSDRTTAFVGSVCGTVFGVLVIGYLWIVKLYK